MDILLILTFLMAAADNELDNTSFTHLVQGEWYDAIVSVFTSVIGEVFFATILLLGPTLLYIKTQNIVPSALAILVGGAVLAVFFTSPIRYFFAIASIIGVTVVLWGMTKK